jgi:hypothetical protein
VARAPALLAIPAVAASLGLAGCSSTLADPNSVVSKIVQANAGVKPSSVSCPSDIPVKKGHTFECTIHVPGQTRTVTVDEVSTNSNGAVLKIIAVK